MKPYRKPQIGLSHMVFLGRITLPQIILNYFTFVIINILFSIRGGIIFKELQKVLRGNIDLFKFFLFL